MPWLVAAAALVGAAVNAIGNMSAQARAETAQKAAFQAWMSLNIPNPADQAIALKEFVNSGTLVPALQNAVKQDPSAFNNIISSPAIKAAQSNALAQLEKIGTTGGLDLQDKEANQEALMQQQVQDRANRENIAAKAARTGQANSGFQVQSQLQAQQGTSDQAARNSLGIASAARQRALQAIEGAGSMANQMEGQDFAESAAKASATDAINRFNAANLQGVNAANQSAQNQANLYNVSNAQDIANKNTGISNQQKLYNAGLLQQQYNNQVQQLSGATGQANATAATTLAGGNMWANLGTNVGTGVAQGITAQQSQNNWDKYFAGQADKQQAPVPTGIQTPNYSYDEYGNTVYGPSY